MKSNSKTMTKSKRTFLNDSLKALVPAAFMVVVLIVIGCQSKLAPLTAIKNAGGQTLPVFLFSNPGPTVAINPNLPIANATPAAVNGVLAQTCFACPVTTWSYPVDIVANTGVTFNDFMTCPGGGPFPCSVQPTGIVSNVVASGLTQNPWAIHCTGWIMDPESPLYVPGPGNYDSAYLRAWPNFFGTNSTYDVSIFNGIQFYIFVSPVDNAQSRQFTVPTSQQQPGPGPPPAGMCQNPNDPVVTHCYDPFMYDYTDIRKGEWIFVQKKWEELKQFGNGSTPNPPTMSGLNLQQVLYFGWVEGNAALSTPVTIDFSVTGCELF